MSRLVYYVAMSLDGYIADTEGGVAWLDYLTPAEGDLGYGDFFKQVDVVIMGAGTYEQLLGFGRYPYPEVESVVMTSRDLPQPEGGEVRFVPGDPAAIVAELKSRHEGVIWLIGGGALAASFAAAGLIDEYDIMVMPALLHDGVRLLKPVTNNLNKLSLLESRTLPGGFVRLRYAVAQ